MSYIPPLFKNTDISKLHDFIKTYSFATLVSHSSAHRVSHLPLLLLPNEGKYGSLIGHLAKANPQWKDFNGHRKALCIFHGPHAYVSPTWYQNKPEVPTWNYAVVHAQGVPIVINDKEELAKLIDDFISLYEPGLHDFSSSNYLPKNFKDLQLEYIVGFKLEIEELVGKFKLGQNRSKGDQEGMLAGLSSKTDNESQQLAKFIKNLAEVK